MLGSEFSEGVISVEWARFSWKSPGLCCWTCYWSHCSLTSNGLSEAEWSILEMVFPNCRLLKL